MAKTNVKGATVKVDRITTKEVVKMEKTVKKVHTTTHEVVRLPARTRCIPTTDPRCKKLAREYSTLFANKTLSKTKVSLIVLNSHNNRAIEGIMADNCHGNPFVGISGETLAKFSKLLELPKLWELSYSEIKSNNALKKCK